MLAWHFLPNDKKLFYKHNGKRIKVRKGQVLRCDPNKMVPCRYGLHGSSKPLDALSYAKGPIVCRTKHSGKILYHGNPVDKLCSEVREILWWADASQILREFARRCALEVVHLWDAPDVVIKYLETGDESIRAAAWDAAWAARDAAWDAARDAAWAARDAAWDAAWAARDAAGDAARDAAGDAAREKQNKQLHKMLLSLKPKESKCAPK